MGSRIRWSGIEKKAGYNHEEVTRKMDLFDKFYRGLSSSDLKNMELYPFFRSIHSAQNPEVMVNGRRMVMTGSNNYLGLNNHPQVKKAAMNAIKKFGTGCAGSRFLNGNLTLHEELERKLAKFFHREGALVFSTGFQTNLGCISSLVGREDVVIIDRWDHASILDGCRMSFGDVKKFRHNNMEDLERILIQENDRGKLIIIDGVFSMEGDIAKLPEISRLAKEYSARVMVDDAHGIGVMGESGRGTLEYFGLNREIDILMGTFSKSLASIGGFIAGDMDIIDYVKHHARSLIFSASIPPPSAAAVSKALDIIEQEPKRRELLWKNAHKMLEGFKSLRFDTGFSETPIIPIIIGDDMKVLQFWKILHEQGVFANPVINPGVPKGRSLIRTSFMATHTDKQLDKVLNAFEKAGKKLKII